MVYENNIIEIELKAVDAAQRIYSAKNPPPIPPSLKRDLAAIGHDVAIMIGLFIIMLASVIVSASHTIPLFVNSVNVGWEWARYVVGIATLIMCELGMILIAYYLVKIKPEDYKAKDLRKLLQPTVVLLLVIMIAGNLFSTYENYYMEKELNQNEPSPTNASLVAYTTTAEDFEPPILMRLAKGIITGLIGFSAPTIAFAVGEILAIVLVMAQAQTRTKQDNYNREYQEWQVKQANFVDATKGQWIIKIKKEMSLDRPLLAVSTVRNDVHMDSEYKTFSRTSDARTKAREFFAQNPDKLDIPCRKLTDEIGVGKSIIAEIQSEIKKAGQDVH